MQVAHSGIKEKCPRCEKEIAFNNLARHVKQVHDNVRKQCPFCPSIQRISRVTSEKFMKMCANIALSVLRCSVLRLWRSTSERFIKALKWSAPRAPNTSLQVVWRFTSDKCTTEKERNAHTVLKTFPWAACINTSEELTRMPKLWLCKCIMLFLK